MTPPGSGSVTDTWVYDDGRGYQFKPSVCALLERFILYGWMCFIGGFGESCTVCCHSEISLHSLLIAVCAASVLFIKCSSVLHCDKVKWI